LNLTSRVAIVTGGARGIGRAVALSLAGQGAAVVINDLGDASSSEEVVNEIRVGEGQSIAVLADVSLSSEVARLVDAAMSTYGRVDILVNNAGINRDQLLVRMSEEDWDRVLSTNLKGAFLCTRTVLRHMIKRRWGRIINISSVVGITGNAGQANYAAAKAGLIGLTRTIAKEMEEGQNWSDEEKVDIVIYHQTLRPLFDMLGVCRLPWIELGLNERRYANFYKHVTGKDTSLEQLLSLSNDIYDLTRLINARLGMNRKDDSLPYKVHANPALTGPNAGKVIDKEYFQKLLSLYYQRRDWDENGIPAAGTESKFQD